jgi:hypothetical protein
MYIEQLEMEGFSGLPAAQIRLERFSRLRGSPRAQVAVADAIHLAFALLDEGLLLALLSRWGCQGVTVEKEGGLPRGATWKEAPGLASLVAVPSEALLKVSLLLSLDPPLFGKIRARAHRDPRLVEAIGGGAKLKLGVGARFGPAFDALSLDLLTLEIGGTSFPAQGSDRPDWLLPLLAGMGRRLQRGAAPEAWGNAARSWDPRQHHALKRAQAAAAAAPFRLGELQVLPDGIGRLDKDALVPLRLLGSAAELAVGLVGAVHLGGADVLLWEGAIPSPWKPWLGRQAEAEASPLEQVILVGAGAGISLEEPRLPAQSAGRSVRVLSAGKAG